MRKAKDGRPFDIDNVKDTLSSTQVEVIQYMRPNGKRRRMAAEVGWEMARKSEDLILSAEILPTGRIALYARFIGQSEEEEHVKLAQNGPGKDNPTAMLVELISEMNQRRE